MEVSNDDNNNNNANIINALGPLGTQVLAGEKLSHKTWRNVLKKLKRKLKRRKVAQEQEKSPSNGDLSEDDAYAMHIREKEMQLQLVEHARWLQREKKAHEEWLNKKWLAEQEKKRQEEKDRRIREEWEEQQKKEKEENEKKELEEKAKKEKQEALLSEATANQKSKNGPSHNPLAPPGYGKETEVCTFFMKTGACRFGAWCSRNHPEPETCHTLMFPGMYMHMILEKSQDDYDADLTLEFEEGEVYDDFKQFYEDVLPEFKNVGHVTQFKVSCNFEPHLRGNVYVQYKTEEETMKAYAKFNGRWYGGKRLSCQVVEIKRWVAAICGLYSENRCHKGKSCNFLHVFRNPTREFNRADRDFESQNHRQHWRENSVTSHRSSSSRYNRYYRSDRSRHSPSPPSRTRSTSRRSPSHKRRKRRGSSSPNHYSRIRSSKRSRHRSRSRSRSWSKSRSRSRSRSRMSSRSKPRSRMQSRSRSRSKSPQNSRSSSSKREKKSYSNETYKEQKRSQRKGKGHSEKSKSHHTSHSKSQSSNKLSSKSRGRSSSPSSPSSSSSSSSSSPPHHLT